MREGDTSQTAFQRAFEDHSDIIVFRNVAHVLMYNAGLGRDMKIEARLCGGKRLLDYADDPHTFPLKVFKFHMKDKGGA